VQRANPLIPVKPSERKRECNATEQRSCEGVFENAVIYIKERLRKEKINL